MNAKAIRSHYIPQFYQRGFISDGGGLIWVYSKCREPKLESVRKTGMGLNLYAFLNSKKELDTTSVEGELAKLDSDGATVIHKLEKGQRLSEEERRILSRFISVMWRRTPKHKEHAEEMASGLMKKFFEEHDENWLYERLKERLGSEPEAMKLFQKQKGDLPRLETIIYGKYLVFFFLTTHYASRCSKGSCTPWTGPILGLHPTLSVTCDDPVVSTKEPASKTRGP